ncbi:UDP-N-acetylmuramoyl-tripeptide--D-alanyl-D-alanine ligase [Deferrisoma camini]|uniref:UDP-N-acetylmuramoyl-tripeptide--D-alanyl-D- alanine ligase n=1 Tax=Deferrisoma camini TaxID=1035120 RepID=UPI00046CA080|nr:UDP-N-acetylmuramoyl-tripeptide--D-alanyl-D-alanine ligase [Deferrisoma camini]
MRLRLADVARATGGELRGGDPERWMERVHTDTRTLRPGDLFVALRGPRHDGHDHLAEAAAGGAAAVVIHRGEPPPGVPAVRVADTLQALGDLAAFVRDRIGFPVVAVTGSAGKTTTRELTAALLSAAGRRVLTSPGNWNNRVGLPLTLLGALGDETAAVLELGISEPGEMAHLTAVARPDVAVITCVGACHTEGLGGIEGVAREKLAIARGLRPGGTLVLPHGDELLVPPPGIRVLTFGWSEGADVRGEAYRTGERGGCEFRVGGRRIRLGLPGRHNAANALAALAAARALGIEPADPSRAWEGLGPAPLRGEVRPGRAGSRLYVDCYNANPTAVEAALETLTELAAGGRAIAVLGEMLELGPLCRAGHEAVGRAAARLGLAELHLLGRRTEAIREGALDAGFPAERIWTYDDQTTLVAAVGRRLRPGDWVLVKGSRALGLEAVADALER